MDDEAFRQSLRKFLKTVGVNSQLEIERALAGALADGTVKGDETLPATMTLDVAGLKLHVVFDGDLTLAK